MKRIGNLFEKIVTFENLLLASKKAIRGKKGKHSVASFYFDLENEIIELKRELESGSYRPGPYTQFEILEPKPRKICSSVFRDRVVHHAICNYLEPIFEDRAIYDSYACREKKGSHVAVVRCQKFTRKFAYYLKCDVRKFFESVDHEVLKRLLRRILKDERLLHLLDLIIDHEVPGGQKGKSIPIGNLTSQHFANFYLDGLDHHIKDHLGVRGYVRYMDDFISFSDRKEDLHSLLTEIRTFLNDSLNLKLKEKVTTLAPVTEGVSFLGFRVYPQLIRIKRENLTRLRTKVRRKEELYVKGKITEKELIQSVGSMVSHVSHANSLSERRQIFNTSLKLA